jgi:hypothetical protein
MIKHAQEICVFTLIIAGFSAPAVYAQTSMPVQVTRTTGLVGIAEGQTAQINALNPAVASSAAPATACAGVLSFIGGDGAVLKTKTVSVAPGTGQHLDIDSVADLALAVGARRNIRATLSIAAASPATSTTTALQPVCELIGTLEIFNTLDGHTLVSLGTSHEVPSPVATPGS